jgi:hypothetical protein
LPILCPPQPAPKSSARIFVAGNRGNFKPVRRTAGL